VAQFDSAYYSSSRAGLEYEAYIADFGPAANGFLNSAAMQSLLEAVVRGRYALDSSKSCYTYYFGGGHLAPHLDDIPGQRPISVLTYLLAAGDGEHPDSGLNLDVYERMVPVPGARQCRIATRETSIVLGYGTEVWHGRRALRSEEKVIVMNGSYALRNDSHCNPAQ
jgi:hypothetical protein